MAKRNIKSTHIRIEVPETLSELNDEADHLLPHISLMAQKRKHSIERFMWQIRNSEFDYEREIFRVASGPHDALYHLLTSSFLFALFLQLGHHKKRGNRNLDKNAFLIAAISQAEMTLACNLLDKPSFERIQQWNTGLGIKRKDWSSHLQGAYSVTRLARGLISEGARVYLPTPKEDVFGKIDLIATFKGRSEGLCIQAKSDPRTDYIGYSTLEMSDVVNAEYKQLIIGTDKFQQIFRGIWIPVFLRIGHTLTEHTYLEPNEVVKNRIHKMLCTILDEHHSFSPSYIL